MIECRINDKMDMSRGEIIGIKKGSFGEKDRLRIFKYYSYTKDSMNESWDCNAGMETNKQIFKPPIIGMTTSIHKKQKRTEFLLREIKKQIPPFNLDGKMPTKTFISSTTNELNEERIRASIGVYEGGSEAIYWEGFSAKNKPAREVMIDYLDTCHIYLGIFAYKYSEPTEKEYRRARELGLPILCFVKNVKEREPKLSSLIEEFKDDEKGITYKPFDVPNELKLIIEKNIPQAIESLFED